MRWIEVVLVSVAGVLFAEYVLHVHWPMWAYVALGAAVGMIVALVRDATE